MTLDAAVAAAERTDAARELIARSRSDAVDLVTMSALELCVLDAPSHPLFEETVARAWLQLGDRRRRKAMEEVTVGLVKRGLLTGDKPPGVGSYSLKPELGLMLAARCRPAFIVVAAGEGHGFRPLSLFALGDLTEPVQAVVAEVPAALPPDRAAARPNAGKLGPLGWIYRYVLASPVAAAEILARWTIAPPPQPSEAMPPRYLVSAYRPDQERPAVHQLSVRGDGSRATVDQPGSANGGVTGAGYNLEGLSAIMLKLLTEASR